MSYYIVYREYKVRETVIVKADSTYEAFEKAGNDIDCAIFDSNESDYEPDYNKSVKLTAYVSDATKAQIG